MVSGAPNTMVEIIHIFEEYVSDIIPALYWHSGTVLY